MRVTWNPFLHQVQKVLTAAQEEFLEIVHDRAAKDSFDNVELGYFWLQMKHMYPLLSEEALKLLMPFSTTDLWEVGFSSAVVIETKTSNKLELEDDFGCSLSTIEPRTKILTKRKQSQKNEHFIFVL